MENSTEQLESKTGISTQEKFKSLFKDTLDKTGMSLHELSSATRISINFLEALKEGEIEKTPGQVFAKGFVKNVANVAGVDASPLLELIEESIKKPSSTDMKFERKSINEKEESSPKITSIKGDISALTKALAGIDKPYKMAAIGLLTLTLGAVLFTGNENPIAVTKKSSPKIALTTKVEKSSTSPKMAEKLVEPREQTAELKTVRAADQGLQILTLQIKKTVKLKTRIDGNAWVVKTFSPDEYNFRFNEKADLLIFDAGAVKASFNGKKLGRLGSSGRVRRLSFVAEMADFHAKKNF